MFYVYMLRTFYVRFTYPDHGYVILLFIDRWYWEEDKDLCFIQEHQCTLKRNQPLLGFDKLLNL